jgi:hypothetical protein
MEKMFEENRDKENDQKAEVLLRQLGFKPNQIFNMSDLEEKVYLLFNILKPEEKTNLVDADFAADANQQTFFECVMEMLDGSNVLQKYYRFISKEELKELKELEGRT